MKRLNWLIAGLIGMLLTTACTPEKTAEPNTGPSNAVFFPAPPAPARLQFLTSFRDAKVFTNPAKSSFADWVVGTEEDKTSRTRIESPYGMAARNGTLYICDVGFDCVHVIDLVNKKYNRLDQTAVRNPVNITIDADGTKYVCDTGAHRVLVFDANDNYVTAFGDPTAWTPIDLAISGNELYIGDVAGGRVLVFDKTTQKELRTISAKGNGPDQLSMPTNLEVGPKGNIYVTDTLQQMVKVFRPDGVFVDGIGGPGADIGFFARPKGIAIDPEGTVYVADSQWDTVQMFRTDGALLMVFGEPGETPYAMGLPAGLAIDASSLPQFRKYIARNFEAEYLLFVINQFGVNKVSVYAFGRDKTLPASAYEVNMEAVERANAKLRAAEKKTTPAPETPKAEEPKSE